MIFGRSFPLWEVPITSITNGVHLPSWLNGDLAALYDQYLEPDWRDRFNDSAIWEQVNEIPDEELLEVHRRRKRRLVSFVRARQHSSALRRQVSAAEVRRSGEVLDPNAFTIGFARRFATYKRATLLFRDVERLKQILLQQRHAGADCDRRQGAPQRPAGQELHPRGGAAFARPRFVEACRVRGRLRHESGPRNGPGRRLVAQQPPARRRSLRHQRHESGGQRRAQPEHPRRLVRRSLRELRRLGYRRPRAVFGRSGRAARQRHLLPARKRDRADVL